MLAGEVERQKAAMFNCAACHYASRGSREESQSQASGLPKKDSQINAEKGV